MTLEVLKEVLEWLQLSSLISILLSSCTLYCCCKFFFLNFFKSIIESNKTRAVIGTTKMIVNMTKFTIHCPHSCGWGGKMMSRIGMNRTGKSRVVVKFNR